MIASLALTSALGMRRERSDQVIARIATTLSGIVLLVYGVIAALSPLPFGVPLIVVAFLMIAGANPAARPVIRRMRRKWRWFDKIVVVIARRSPSRFKEVIEETAPESNYGEDAEEDTASRKPGE